MKKKIINNLLLSVKILAVTFVIIASLITASVTLNIFPFYKAFIVLSNSMSPTINQGDIVFVKQQNNYVSKDIITFKPKNSANLKDTTTHRIVSVDKDSNNKYAYKTKGDANSSNDPTRVNKDQIVGKTVFSVPFIGYFISFIRTQNGMLLFIVIPSTLIIWEEIKSILKQTKQTIINIKTKNNTYSWHKIIIYNIKNNTYNFANYYKLNCNSQFSSPWQKISVQASFVLLGIIFISSLTKAQSTGSYLAVSRNITGNELFSAASFSEVSLDISSDKKTAKMKVARTNGYIKLHYKLTFNTDTNTQGIEGDINLSGENNVDRTFDLGTCTTNGTCTYYNNPHNFYLEVILENSSGNKVTLSKTV